MQFLLYLRTPPCYTIPPKLHSQYPANVNLLYKIVLLSGLNAFFYKKSCTIDYFVVSL